MSLIIAADLASHLHTLALDHFVALERQDPALAGQVLRADYVNTMAADEPPACSRAGVPGLMATAAWLHLAFPDLAFEIEHIVSDTQQTVARVSMTGTQRGPFVVFPPGQRPMAFPPTGRAVEVRQVHVFSHDQQRHTSHLAVREDLPMMTQLGHLPPSPSVALRLARAGVTGASRRAVRQAAALAEQAADRALGGAA